MREVFLERMERRKSGLSEVKGDFKNSDVWYIFMYINIKYKHLYIYFKFIYFKNSHGSKIKN